MYLVVKHSGIYSTMLPSIVISIVLASFVSAESSITEAPTTTAEDNPYTIYPSVARLLLSMVLLTEFMINCQSVPSHVCSKTLV